MVAFWRNFSRWTIGVLVVGFANLSYGQMPVVSTSLCADNYVLELLEQDQIKSLSWQANSLLSLAPDELRVINGAWDEAENLLALAPSKIVLGAGDKIAATSLAQSQGSRAFQIPWASDFEGVNKARLQLGVFLQRPAKAKQAADVQSKRLLALTARSKNRKQELRVLYLTPSLGTAGAGTFVDAAIKAAGGINLASEYGISGWGQLPLEKLVSAHPDLIITSFFKAGPPSVLQFRANHFLLHSLTKQVPFTHIYGGLWVCAGPSLIIAAEQIADAMDQLEADNS